MERLPLSLGPLSSFLSSPSSTYSQSLPLARELVLLSRAHSPFAPPLCHTLTVRARGYACVHAYVAGKFRQLTVELKTGFSLSLANEVPNNEPTRTPFAVAPAVAAPLVRLADAFCRGDPSPLPPGSVSLPFGDALREKELTGSRAIGLALSRRVVISARRAPRNTSPSPAFPAWSECMARSPLSRAPRSRSRTPDRPEDGGGDELIACACPGELQAETEAETPGELPRL